MPYIVADGLAIDAAFAMARRAYELLVDGSTLAPPQYRNEVEETWTREGSFRNDVDRTSR